MSNTIERRITRLLTEAVEEHEPKKVQAAYESIVFLKESNALTDPQRAAVSDDPSSVSPYLYLYCAEAAARFEQWDIVTHCIEKLRQDASLLAPSSAVVKQNSQQQQQQQQQNINNNANNEDNNNSGTSKNNNNNNNNNNQLENFSSALAWVDFSVRTLYVEASLAAREMINKRGAELILASKIPLAKTVRGIAVAVESKRSVLAFAGIQQLWNIAQPLFKPGTCHILSDVFVFANKALDSTGVQDPELRSKWAMRLATCLNSPNNSTNRDAEAAIVILSAEQQYSTSRNIVPLARATLAAAAAAKQNSGNNNNNTSSSGETGVSAADKKGQVVTFQSLLLASSGVAIPGSGNEKAGASAAGGGGGGKGNNSAGTGGMTFDKNGNPIGINVAAAVARVLPVLNDASSAVPLALSHGGVHPDCHTSHILTSPPSPIGENLNASMPDNNNNNKKENNNNNIAHVFGKNIIDDILTCMKDLSLGIQLQASFVAAQNSKSKGIANNNNNNNAKQNANNNNNNKSINANPASPTATSAGAKGDANAGNNLITLVDGILDETLAECAFLAALLGVPTNQETLATACERCLVSRSHIARVYAELANAVLQAQRCEGVQLHIHSDTSRISSNNSNSNNNNNPIVNGLVSAVRRIEITIEGALRVQDELLRNTIVERCVTTMWNLALPLLNSTTRLSLNKSFKAAVRALAQVGSTNNILIAMLEHELALHEADQHFTGKAAERLDSCLKLDVIPSTLFNSSSSSGSNSNNNNNIYSASPEASFINEHERWMKYQLKGLQVKKDLYTKHTNNPELEALRTLHQAIDTVPDARPPILARVMSILEDSVSPLALELGKSKSSNSSNNRKNSSDAPSSSSSSQAPLIPRRSFPLDVNSWNLEIVSETWQNILCRIYENSNLPEELANILSGQKDGNTLNNDVAGGKKAGGSNNNNNNAKNSNAKSSSLSSPTKGAGSQTPRGKAGDQQHFNENNNNNSPKQPPFINNENDIISYLQTQNGCQNFCAEQIEALMQQQWERAQMWSTLRSCAWSFPTSASVELVRRVSETLLQLPSADREIVVEQIKAALSHAETFIYEAKQLGLRFGQFELTATSPEELQSDLKNFQNAIEGCRAAEGGFLTMVVAAALLSHHVVISKGNKEERWTMLNCAITLWQAFRESFESNLYVIAFPAFQKLVPLFVSVMSNGQVLLGSELNGLGNNASNWNSPASSLQQGGGKESSKSKDKDAADNNNNSNGIMDFSQRVAPGQQNPCNEPCGTLPSTFETSLVSNFGVAAVRAALQKYVADCLKVDLTKPSIGDLRRIAATDFTRLPGANSFAHEPGSPLLASAHQWCESLIPLCIPSDARELCKLSVVIRRYQGKPAEVRVDPVLQITTLIELADSATTSDERSFALVQAVELLQSPKAQTVELCSRVADACARYPGCERLCIATCAIAQDLYANGKLGKPNRNLVKDADESNNNNKSEVSKKSVNRAPLKSSRGANENNQQDGEENNTNNSSGEHNQHLPPDPEDWMFFAVMLQCQGCASARLTSSSDSQTAEKILLRALENLANSAAAGTRVLPTHRLKIVARSICLFKLAADELISVAHGSSQAVRSLLPALRAILSPPVLAILQPAVSPSSASSLLLSMNPSLMSPQQQQQLIQLQQQQEMLQDVAPSLIPDLSRLMLLMVKSLHLESLAEEGLSFLLNNALKLLPNSEHKAFWDLDAAMRCSTGTPLNTTLLKVKEYDVHTQAQVWAAIARNAKSRQDQLFALTHASKCYNPMTHPLEHATHLIALANWLLRFDYDGRGITLSDIRSIMLRAIDIVWRDFTALVLPPSAFAGMTNKRSSSSPAGATMNSMASSAIDNNNENNNNNNTPRSEFANDVKTAKSITNYGGAAITSSRASSVGGKSSGQNKGGARSGSASNTGTSGAFSTASPSQNIDAIRKCCDARSLIALLECVVAYCAIAPVENALSAFTKQEALLVAHACVVTLWKNTLNSVNPLLMREAVSREQREMREQIQLEMMVASNNNGLNTSQNDDNNAGTGGQQTSSKKSKTATAAARPGRNTNSKKDAASNSKEDPPTSNNTTARNNSSEKDRDGNNIGENTNNNNNNIKNQILLKQPQIKIKPSSFSLPSTVAGWCNLTLTPIFGAALLRLKDFESQPASFFTVRDPVGLCCVLEIIHDMMVESEMEALAAPVAALEEVVVSYLWTPSHNQEVTLLACDMKRRSLAVALGVSKDGGRKEMTAMLRKELQNTMSLLGASLEVVVSSATNKQQEQEQQMLLEQQQQEEEENDNKNNNNIDNETNQDQQDGGEEIQQQKSNKNSNKRKQASASSSSSSINQLLDILPESNVASSTSARYISLTNRWLRIVSNYFKIDNMGNATLSLTTDIANLCHIAGDEAGMNRAMILAAKILHNQGQPARTIQVLHGVSHIHLKPQEMIDAMTEEASVLLQLEDVPSATAVLDALHRHINVDIVQKFSTSQENNGRGEQQENEANNDSNSYSYQKLLPKPHLALRQFVEETMAPELQFLFVTKTAQILLFHSNRTRLRAAVCDALCKYVAGTFIKKSNSNETIPSQWRLAAQLLWLKVSSVLNVLTEERQHKNNNNNNSNHFNNASSSTSSSGVVNLPKETRSSLETIRQLVSTLAFDFNNSENEFSLHTLVGGLSLDKLSPACPAIKNLLSSNSSSCSSLSSSSSSSSSRSSQIHRAFGILSEEIIKLAALKRNAVEIYRTLPHVAAITYPTVEGAERAGLGAALSSFMRSTKRTRRAEAKAKSFSVAKNEVEKQRDLIREERAKEVEARRSQRKHQEDQAVAAAGSSKQKATAAQKKFGVNALPSHLMSEVDFGFTPLDRTCGIPSPEPSDSDEESLDEDSHSDDDREVGRACEEVLKHEVKDLNLKHLLQQQKSSVSLMNNNNNKASQHQKKKSTATQKSKIGDEGEEEQAAAFFSALSPALTSWAQSTLLALNAGAGSEINTIHNSSTSTNDHYFNHFEQNDSNGVGGDADDEDSEVQRSLALAARLLHLSSGEPQSSVPSSYLFQRSVDGFGGINNRKKGSSDLQQQQQQQNQTGGGKSNKQQNNNNFLTGTPAGKDKQKAGAVANSNNNNNNNNAQVMNARKNQGGAGLFGNLGGNKPGSPTNKKGTFNGAANSFNYNSSNSPGSFHPSIDPLSCNTERTGLDLLQKIISSSHQTDQWKLLGAALGLAANATALPASSSSSTQHGVNELSHELLVAKLFELSQAATMASDVKQLWQQLVQPSCAERVAMLLEGNYDSSRMVQRLRLSAETIRDVLQGITNHVMNTSDNGAANNNSYSSALAFGGGSSSNNTNHDQLPVSFTSGNVFFLTITRGGLTSRASNDSNTNDLLYAILRRGPSSVDLRTFSVAQSHLDSIASTFAAIARQRQNVLAKPASSTARGESLSSTEATFRVAMSVFAETLRPLLGDFKLAFEGLHNNNAQLQQQQSSSSLPQLVLCLDMELQGLPWEKLSYFHHEQKLALQVVPKKLATSEQQPQPNVTTSSSTTTSPSYFRSISRDLSLYHCIARQVCWKKFEVSSAAAQISAQNAHLGGGLTPGQSQQQQQQGGGKNSNAPGGGPSASSQYDLANSGPFSFANSPSGICMSLVDQSRGTFDLASDTEHRPRGYNWRHAVPTGIASPFEGALSPVESWFTRTLLGAESGALFPTSLLFASTTSGRFTNVVRASLWCAMDLSHVRAAYLIDGGMTPASSIVDESALVKSASASINAQPHVVSLLMLARGVDFVLSSSYRLPMTPHAANNLTKLVTRVAGGEVIVMNNSGANAIITGKGNNNTNNTNNNNTGSSGNTGGEQKSGGGKGGNNKQEAASDPVILTNSNNQSSAIISKNVAEVVHYALHCQPVILYQQQQQKAAIEATTIPITPTTTSTSSHQQKDSNSNKRTSSKEGRKEDANNAKDHKDQNSTVEKSLAEMSEAETSCISVWGASI